jgi:hypothetical protein
VALSASDRSGGFGIDRNPGGVDVLLEHGRLQFEPRGVVFPVPGGHTILLRSATRVVCFVLELPVVLDCDRTNVHWQNDVDGRRLRFGALDGDLR